MLDLGEDTPPSAIEPGQELLDGRLVVRGLLGRGSMGVVYRADDRLLGREVALKTLVHFDAERLYQLKREFRTLARVSHPGLVQLYELGASGTLWFVIMELVRGMEMSRWLRQKPERGRVLRVLGGLFEAVRVLHAAGQLHRDIKPSNVMVTPDDRAVLLDFGLAAPIRGRAMTMAAGTLDYMAPEQLWSLPVGPPADWYSFGVVVFEALTGQIPFAGNDKLKAMRQRPGAGPRDLVADIPEDIDRVVRGLLDPDPDSRPTVEELAAVLHSSGEPRRATTPAASPRRLPFVGRKEAFRQLHQCLTQARQGHTNVVHVSGPSGIGKTALAERFLTQVRVLRNTLVLEGACHPHESVPYKALDALIDNLARHLIGLDDRVVLALAPRHAGALLHLFPVLGRVPAVRQWPASQPQLSPAEVRRRGFEALRELIGKLADENTVVLWIDDIQWSDRDSGPALRVLLGPPDPPRLLLLLTSRDEPAVEQLMGVFKDSVSTTAIVLSPLSMSEARELARDLSTGVTAGMDLDSVANESGGSPFLLGELIRHFRDSDVGRLLHQPLSVGEVVRARLGSLSIDARRLLEVVATAGRPLDLELALAVSAVGTGGHLLVHLLCSDYLLRISTQDERAYLETYHDRIREFVLADLDPATRRTRHADLAAAIRASRNPDPGALVRHYLGADDRAQAAHYALLAADKAERDLAFDLAVEMYDLALELGPESRSDRSILSRRALALANAVRRVEAGVAYEAAALVPGGDGHDEARIELRGQAAEQFFCGGDLRKGISVLKGVLDDVGVKVPERVVGRVMRGQWLRGRFIVRGTRLTPGAPIDSRTRARMDALWRATRGVVMLDPILADVLAGTHLLDALRLGDFSRAHRAMALEAAFEANLGGAWFRARSQRLLDESEKAVVQNGDAYDQAWLTHCRAACAWFDGRWRESVRLGETAETSLKVSGASVAWDLAVLQGFMLSALANLGDLRELSKRQTALIADAERRQDQYALRVFRTGDAVMPWLVRGEAGTALKLADDTLGDYRTGQFISQHRHHLVATVLSHLYDGHAEQAWARVASAWRPLRWSGFLFLDCLGTQLRYLRACAAIAVARSGASAPGPLVRVARHEMGRIRRSTLPMASPMAFAIEAGVAGVLGQRDEQIAALRAASNGFQIADMALHRAACDWHLASLVRDGADLRAASARWMTGEGVVNPPSMARAVVPPA